MNFRITTRVLALLLLTCLILPVTAKVIDQVTAEKAAKNYLFEKLSQKQNIAYADVVVSTTYTVSDNNVPVYYGVNFRDGGFVLITAETNTTPILGYSPTGFFNPANQADNFRSWMNGAVEQVKATRERSTPATSAINNEWKRITDEAFSEKPVSKSGKSVDPFVMSHWDQGKYFNTLCPVDGAGPEGHALTGCVATAMSQVLYYYRYPSTATGTHTYGTNGNPSPYGHYGTISVNYTNTTSSNPYNYDGMVNDPTESNLEMARLMYHVGVSVSMKYGPTASGAVSADCVGALTSHFRYSGTAANNTRSNYTVPVWHNMLMTEFDARRPVLYSGRNPSYGHCFVCDGYQIGTSDTLYHFNWGWSGNYDGFYNINDLNPGNDPNGAFDQQSIVKGIYPANSFPSNCTGQKAVSSNLGTIEDGSSNNANYTDNADCSWLITPADSVKKYSISFNRFDTEAGNDIVTVYDGDNTNAPVLLTASGSTLPSSVMTTGGKFLVTFKTNASVNAQGWMLTYKPIYPTYCSGTTLTAPSGVVSDGSGARNYNNNSTCSWIIQPPNPDNKTLILDFTEFNTEAGQDIVKVYDLVSQQQIGPSFSGTNLPSTLVSPSGQMYIEFKTNYVYNYTGWSANYSLGFIGIDEVNGFSEMKIYPNPANDHLNVNFKVEGNGSLNIELLSLTGQSVIKESYDSFNGIYNKSLDLGNIARGVYTLRLTGEKGVFTQKVVVQ